MDSIRPDTPAARFVAQHLKTENFVLIDVGCSGGVNEGWRCLGDRLQAFGFDIWHDEIARLNRVETNPLVEYHAGMVGVLADDPRHQRRHNVYGRPILENLSYIKTQELRERVQYKDGAWAALERQADSPPAADESRMAAPEDVDTIVLPSFLKSRGVDSVDFIKIDVDGMDYIILQSLEEAFGPAQVLGLGLEVTYYGSALPTDNVFHNVDRLMRGADFGLFELLVRNYSSASLPWPFALPHPYAAQSVRGRPYQGDALYMRDAAASETRGVVDALSVEKLAKLIAIFAIFHLPDQAAEICIRYRARLAALLDVDALLDLLALQIQEEDGGKLSYAQYMQRYQADDPAIYGQGAQYRLDRLKDRALSATWLQEQVDALSQEVSGLRSRVQTTYDRLRAQGCSRPLDGGVKSFVEPYASTDSIPGIYGVPPEAWGWGGASAPIVAASPVTLRLDVKPISGTIGFCLMTEDFSDRISVQRHIRPSDGRVTVELETDLCQQPFRLGFYNFGDQGQTGELEILDAELLTWPIGGS
jgi:hypothetical protein